MATRKLRIQGASQDATLTVTMDGVEIYNGPGSGTNPLDLSSYIAEISFENDNTQETTRNIVITCTAGTLQVGPILYNFYPVVNPLLTPTERGYWDTNTTADAPADVGRDVRLKGGWTVELEDQFLCGSDDRSNYAINGETLDPSQYAAPPFVPFDGWVFEIAQGNNISFTVSFDPVTA
jgi:hypothetical protein